MMDTDTSINNEKRREGFLHSSMESLALSRAILVRRDPGQALDIAVETNEEIGKNPMIAIRATIKTKYATRASA